MQPDVKSEKNLSPDFGKQSEGVIVHAIRITTKAGIVLALFFSQSPSILPLTIYLVITEILDQVSLQLSKVKPETRKWIGIFYALNSVTVISSVIYFADWSLTDFYLIYLVHISSSTLAYGFKNGLVSFALSMLSYGLLLFMNQASFVMYLRLPLLSILVLRLLVSQLNYEKTNKTLGAVLGVEKSKQDFIALASHNLRTPVAAIYGYIDVLLRGDAGALNDQQSDYLKKIKNNNQELEKITEQLLEISILEVGREVNLMKQLTQIEVLIEDIVEKYSSAAKAKSIELNFHKDSSLLPMVNIDIDKIKSVLSNLIDNAIKYTEKGGVAVTVVQNKNFLTISVKDTGMGIAKEELPKVFNKFYRSGNVLVYNQTGVGLGLFLGKKIVELHGGDLSVESSDQGSAFFLTLPIIEEKIFE